MFPNFSVVLGVRYNWQDYLHDNDQFAPRFAFAYSPGKSRKTVIRGGSGIFYDRTGANPISDLLTYNGEILQSFQVTDPATLQQVLNHTWVPSAQPSNIVQLDPNIHEPYTIQYSIAVERQVSKRTTIVITYNGTRGVGLFPRSHVI